MNFPKLPYTALFFMLLSASYASCQHHDIASVVLPIYESSEENFEGPFDSWYDVKKDFGAKGDATTDDTKAIQTAFDALKLNKKKVVYFPEGTYKITNTLLLSSLINISILGANPEKTTIHWDGEKGGTMMDCNGVSYSRFGRITWDGDNKAKCAVNHGWDGKRPYANTFGEHADEVYKNIDFGLRGGSRGFMDAECVVKRCRFYNCKKAGISLENFNAADWEIWYCSFIKCYIGVTNKYGAGPFNVYNSYFSGSEYADISKYHCGFYAFRHNISINSTTFFVGENHDCPGLVTLQGNKVYNTSKSTAIQIGDEGPTLILDNTILSKNENIHQPVIDIAKGETCTSIGNTFNSLKPYNVYRSLDSICSIDDKIVNANNITPIVPSMPDFAKTENYVLFEVPANANDSLIQIIVNKAAKSNAPKTVIHFSAGKYPIKNSIILPAKKELILIGDGRDACLDWKLKTTGTILRLEGPNHSIVKELSINGNKIADGILVENCDQLNAQIIMDQCASRASKEYGFLADQLDNTRVILYNGYHNRAENVAIKAIGGARKNKGEKTNGRFCLFGGASSDNNNSYDVARGADMVINDIWYETGGKELFNTLTDSSRGNLTLCGVKVATKVNPFNSINPDSSAAGIDIKGFQGNLSILNLMLFSRLIIHQKGNEHANILASYTAKDSMFINLSNKAKIGILGYSAFRKDGGATAVKIKDLPSNEFIIKMLAPERINAPIQYQKQKKNITDVRMNRVTVERAKIGFKFTN